MQKYILVNVVKTNRENKIKNSRKLQNYNCI